MTLEYLINNHHFLSIESELIRLYPDEQGQIEAYRDVFHQLRLIPVEPSDITIRLKKVTNEDENFIDVDGYYTDGRVDEQSGNDALALEFIPWEKWLGMKIDQGSHEAFAELEIIAHCLYEMTFISFDQEEIRERLNDLKKTVDEYDQMSPEERNAKTTSMEDFLKELDEKNGFLR